MQPPEPTPGGPIAGKLGIFGHPFPTYGVLMPVLIGMALIPTLIGVAYYIIWRVERGATSTAIDE